MQLLIFGLGYSGTALAAQAAAASIPVTIATRQPNAAAPAGVRLVQFDEPGAALVHATHLVATAAPGESGDPVLARHGAAIATAPGLRWIGYLSTTGVYGNRDGAWVDETSAPSPYGERGGRRVAAEQAWLATRPDVAVDWFRLAGIYGPGRSALDDVRAGRARRVDKPGHLFGRIHRDDIAGALLAAIGQIPTRGSPRAAWCPTTSRPASAGRHCRSRPPAGDRSPSRSSPSPWAEPTMSPMARSLLGR